MHTPWFLALLLLASGLLGGGPGRGGPGARRYGGLGVAAQSSSSPDNASFLNFDKIPECAISCIIGAVMNSTCTPSDRECTCSDASIEAAATACTYQACSLQETFQAKAATEESCGATVRDRSGLYNRISIALGTIAIIFGLVRLYWRLYVVPSRLYMDDHCLHLAWVLLIPSIILNSEGLAAHGLGRDIWTLDFAMVVDFSKFFYVMQILYFAHVPLLKLAWLFFYLRIFQGRWCKRVLWATVAVNGLGMTAYMLVAMLQCRPVRYYWERWEQPGYDGWCVDANAMGLSHAVCNIVLDAWLLVVPISQVWRLNLHWKKKLGVGMMFCVGLFVTIITILRANALVTFANTGNPTFEYWELALWSTVEVSIGIVCACMPAVRGLVIYYFPGALGGGARDPDVYPMYAHHNRRRKSVKETNDGSTTQKSKQDRYFNPLMTGNSVDIGNNSAPYRPLGGEGGDGYGGSGSGRDKERGGSPVPSSGYGFYGLGLGLGTGASMGAGTGTGTGGKGPRDSPERKRSDDAIKEEREEEDEHDGRDKRGITYTRSFIVEYEPEPDESSLVIMRPSMPAVPPHVKTKPSRNRMGTEDV